MARSLNSWIPTSPAQLRTLGVSDDRKHRQLVERLLFGQDLDSSLKGLSANWDEEGTVAVFDRKRANGWLRDFATSLASSLLADEKALPDSGRKGDADRDLRLLETQLVFPSGTSPAQIELSRLGLGSWAFQGGVPPYVERTSDAHVRAHLVRAGLRMVLLVGPPKSGKTRSLAQVLRSLDDSDQLTVWWAHRASRQAIPTIARVLGNRSAGVPAERVIVVLDDLQLFGLDLAGGSGERDIRRILDTGATIAATVHSDFLARITATSFDHSFQSGREMAPSNEALADILQSATVSYASVLDRSEVRRIPPGIRERVLGNVLGKEIRLAEELAAVQQLTARAREALESITDPHRSAVVNAALDASVLYPEGVERDWLTRLGLWAFSRVTPNLEWRPEQFDAAVGWALMPIGGPGSVHALLQRDRYGRYSIFDALPRALLPRGWQPDRVVEHRTELQAEQTNNVGSYLAGWGHENTAFHWFGLAATKGDSFALMSQGAIRLRQGPGAPRLIAAILLQMALDQGETRADLYLGWLDEDRGDYDDAIDRYRRAAAAGEPVAMRMLWEALDRAGGVASRDEARRCRQSYVNVLGAEGAFSVGCGLLADDFYDEATHWLAVASDAGHMDATHQLVHALCEGGEILRARAHLLRLGQTGDLFSRLAYVVLTHAFDKEGVDIPSGWEDELTQLRDRDALYDLGLIVARASPHLRDPSGEEARRVALEVFKRAGELEHAEALEYAATIQDVLGDPASALNSRLRAASLGNLEAMNNLASIFESNGNREEAARWAHMYRFADIEARLTDLVDMLYGGNERSAQDAILERTLDRESTTDLLWLGLLQRRSGDFRGARISLERAVGVSADSDVVEVLIHVLSELGDHSAADQWRASI
jgi:TPR repeat protein